MVAKLGLEVDEGVFATAEKMIHGLSKGFLGLGVAFGAYAAAMQGMMRSTASAAGAANKAAQITGTTTDAIQELHFAFGGGEEGAASLDHALGKLSRTAYAASQGSAEARGAFHALGVGVLDASGKLKPTDKLLENLAEKFKTLENGPRKVALAQAVFGRSGAELLPFLNKGAEGIGKLREEARELGVVLDSQTIQDAKEFKKANHELEASLEGLKYAIGGPLIKGAGDLAAAFAHFVAIHRKSIAAVVRKPYELLRDTLKWVAKNMWAVKLALAAATTYIVITHIPAILAAITAAWAWVASLTAVQVASWAAGFAAAAAGAAATLGWAALALAIVLAADELYTFATGGESYIGDLNKALEDWFDNPKFDPQKSWLGTVLDFFKTMLYTVTHIGETIAEWGKLYDWAKNSGGEWVKGRLDATFGAPPSRQAAAGGGVSNRGTFNMTINAPPGMSEKQLAHEASTQLEDWWNNELQQSIPAVAPER